MVRDNPLKQRYELEVEGSLAVAEYRLEGKNLVITHVEVPPALQGKGIAAQVMEGVAGDAEARGLTIVPICSYAAVWMKRKEKV